MDTRAIAQVLTDFREILSAQIEVRELIVFGSYLEGTATEDSDLDVIVVSDDFEGMSEDERLDIVEAAAESSDPPIHPWGFTRREVESASELTTLGYARRRLIRLTPDTSTVVTWSRSICHRVHPEFAEGRPVYLRDNAHGFPRGGDAFRQPPLFFLDHQRHFRDLDPFTPAQRNGAGQRVMQEVDDIVAGIAEFSVAIEPLRHICARGHRNIRLPCHFQGGTRIARPAPVGFGHGRNAGDLDFLA